MCPPKAIFLILFCFHLILPTPCEVLPASPFYRRKNKAQRRGLLKVTWVVIPGLHCSLSLGIFLGPQTLSSQGQEECIGDA